MTHIPLRILASGIVLSALIARGVFKLDIDAITVGLLFLGILPWLAPLIKSVEIPGIGKIEMQELRDKAEEASGAARSATQKAEFALANVSQRTASSSTEPRGTQATDAEMKAAIVEYSRLRETLKPGDLRTSQMTQVVARMISLAPGLETFDVLAALKDVDRGIRLAAYATLYACPAQKFLDQLVSSVATLEDKPFGQYWGILAIRQAIGQASESALSPASLVVLREWLKRLPTGTDRHYELTRLLRELRAI